MKHTKEEWKEIVKEFEKSCQSQRVWSKEHGEYRNRLYYWIIHFKELFDNLNIF